MNLQFVIIDDVPAFIVIAPDGKKIVVKMDDESDHRSVYETMPRLHNLFLGAHTRTHGLAASEDFYSSDDKENSENSIDTKITIKPSTTGVLRPKMNASIMSEGEYLSLLVEQTIEHEDDNKITNKIGLNMPSEELLNQYMEAFLKLINELPPAQLRRMKGWFDFGQEQFDKLTESN